jgi:hypothetical protein
VLRRKIQKMRKYDPMFMCASIHHKTYSTSEAYYLNHYRASVNIGRERAN